MNYTDYIKEELLCLIPVLFLIGRWIKSSGIGNNKIPFVLGVVGVCMAGLYVLATSDIGGIKQAAGGLFTAIVQGLFCAAGAVYGHQLYKQAKNSDK